RRLTRGLRPRVGEFALVAGAVVALDQHVRDATTLGAGQPGRDERIRAVQFLVHVQRPPADVHRHHWDALAVDLVQHRGVFGVQPGRFEGLAGQVADALGVRRLADDRDDRVVAGRVDVAGAAEGDVRVAEIFAQPGQDRGGVGEVGVRVA